MYLTDLDGIRIDFPDWWFNLRVSNTEPLLRLVVETTARDNLKPKTGGADGEDTAVR